MKRCLALICVALALMASPGLCETTARVVPGMEKDAGTSLTDDGGNAGTRIRPGQGEPGGASPDGAYRRFENGIVYDPATRLEWLAGPDQRINWNEARTWAEGLSIAGGGWRMPTREELQTLYREGSGSRNMTPFLKTSGWFIWSGETKDFSTAWIFNFYYNGFELYDRRDDRNGNRAFAVRPVEK